MYLDLLKRFMVSLTAVIPCLGHSLHEIRGHFSPEEVTP